MERGFEILIVEDDVGLALNLKDILEEKGYPVAVAHNGQTAHALFREKIFDLALIDLKIPDMSGEELIEQLTALSPRTEYMIITGYASLESAAEAVRKKNIIAYEIKPIDIDHLLSFLNQVTERKQAEEGLSARNRDMAVLNRVAIELASIQASRDLYPYIATTLKKLTSAAAATFAVYDSQKQELHVEQAELDKNLITDLMNSLGGKKLTEARFPVSADARRDLIQNPVRIQNTLSEITFGVVSKTVGKIVQKAQGTDRFVGIAYVVAGELYGTTVLGLRAGHPNPSLEMLQSFAHLVAVSLKRKQAEEALRKLKEFNEGIIQGMVVGIFVQDVEGVFSFVNPAGAAMLGYEPEELLGHHWTVIVPADQQPIIQAAEERRARGESDHYELDLVRKDGVHLSVLMSGSPRFKEGHFSGTLGVFTDITRRKRAEEEAKDLQEQLRQSQKMEAIGQLAGGIAHDFNNLLTIIIGYAQISLFKLPGDDPLRENIDQIKKAADRASALIGQILAFSRRQIMEMKVFDLNTLLRDLEKMLRRIIGEDVDLVTAWAEDLGRVKTDPGQIEQVIMNLAVNARDAMPEGGKLTIETANVELDESYARNHVPVTPGHYVMLSVSDSGVGMTPEVKERVFEPFFSTKEKGEGTGLGLSTVYGIVKQSGGNIWVYSEPGKGTTFKIYLPRVDEPLEKDWEKIVESEVPRGTETILVVEDDEQVRKFTVQVLQKQGYKVLEASHGEEALLLCEQHKEPIHLMVTDVVMPGMSGGELAKWLIAKHPEMRIIYMSGYTENVVARHGVLKKDVNYIQKPFTVDGLARKVRRVLDK